MKNFKSISMLLTAVAVIGSLFFAISCQDDADITGPGAGSLKSLKSTITLGTDPDIYGNTYISSDLTLSSGNTYYLNGYIRVEDGATLFIDPGVTIIGKSTMSNPASGSIADPATTPGTLIIERGGKIEAEGTPNQPIVFTGETATIGAWGGVILLGRACNNLASGEGEIEGLPVPGTTVGIYGAANRNFVENDSSGTLRYVRIEYAGNSLNEETGNETNALTLGSVGKGTTIDHVMVCYGNDDGFEFFGGDVDAKYLIAYRNRDDDFDTDQGYCGRIQFGISYAFGTDDTTVFPVNGFESNGDVDDNPVSAFTDGTFSNFTVIGPIDLFGNSSINPPYNSGAIIRDRSALDVFNSIICGFPYAQVELEDSPDFQSSTGIGPIQMEGVTLVAAIYGNFSSAKCAIFSKVLADADFTADASWHNETLYATKAINEFPPSQRITSLTGLDNAAWTATAPSFVPNNEKPSDFSNPLVNDGWFDIVDFRGAMGSDGDGDWNIYDAWVDWTPGD